MTGIIIHTDGACSGNPGPGGWAAVLTSGKHRREISGGFRRTTNNRMELMAVIEALKRIKRPSKVTVYSDSQYVVNAMSKGWAERWRANGWKRTPKEKALNPDLWAELLDQAARHDIEFRWVRGHDGDEENELCDRLSVQASKVEDLPEDEGYVEQK